MCAAKKVVVQGLATLKKECIQESELGIQRKVAMSGRESQLRLRS